MTRLCRSMILLVLIAACALCAGCTAPAPGEPTPTPVAPATVTGSVTGTAGDTSVALALTARNIAFDKSTLAAPAGSTVALTFVNDDPGVPHNFALYTDASATTTLFRGEVVTGPATTTYTFPAPAAPGSYFYRCDPHPTTMTGSFVVT